MEGEVEGAVAEELREGVPLRVVMDVRELKRASLRWIMERRERAEGVTGSRRAWVKFCVCARLVISGH